MIKRETNMQTKKQISDTKKSICKMAYTLKENHIKLKIKEHIIQNQCEYFKKIYCIKTIQYKHSEINKHQDVNL